ncbi:hypothetical protein HQ545_05505 [Candidatus Woesearchaeota archaeon]|nr:hypothetical protein [Candidatus Woesearchaeota archaeon]
MEDNFEAANEELKRADHLIFVSLKYTRTCDVLKSVVERLINCMGFTFTGLLEHLKEEGKIEEIPTAPIPKANLIKQLFPDDEFLPEFADLFMRLRKISQAEFSRSTEFRRHVTMTVVVAEEIIKIDIDLVTEYFKNTKEFYEHVMGLVSPQS